jgi:argininosuccinate lyase
MPQKKNPDAAELLRAKAPRIVAHHAALHGVMHGLPLTYNKDLQEDKEHVFDTADTLALSLTAARGMLATVTFARERLAAAASDELIAAVDLADQLVSSGVPFREAHGIVAGLVRVAVADGRSLSSFSDGDLTALAPAIDPQAFRELLNRQSWLESKVSVGGTALVRVREQLAAAQAALAAG